MDTSRRSILLSLTAGWLLTTLPAVQTFAEDPAIVFDLPPMSAAAADPSDPGLVTFQLRLSAMFPSADPPRIDQYLIRCLPRQSEGMVVDYSPRTETASDYATPIQIKETEESTQGFGISLDANHTNMLRGHAGSDQASKSSSSQQFDRVAPQEAVIAAGTIDRGRGVFFKLRWTAVQVLEGEKQFSVTLRVPDHWRGDLVDVSIVAQSKHKSLVTREVESKVVGSADFVVAVYREGDTDAQATAEALVAAEKTLRDMASKHRCDQSKSLPNLLRTFARKLDFHPDPPSSDWLLRLLRNQADPHLDNDICHLTMQTRLAVLNYDELRSKFFALSTR